VEVPGLLDHPAAGEQYGRLPLDLRVHSTLDRAQRVDVLGLTARAPRLTRSGQRHIDVAAQRALLHAHVRHPERAHQVAQLGDVGTGDEGGERSGADDRLGHDLDERDPGAVVVDEGVVGTVDASGGSTGMGQLAGVLLHVDALDLDPEVARAVVGLDRDIEPAVEAQRLVVLADLVVLGHVRIEVVLAREPAPLRDAAVERQAHADRRLHGCAVDDGHRPGKTEAYRADLRVGIGTEGRRA